jgi:hypothetical protein
LEVSFFYPCKNEDDGNMYAQKVGYNNAHAFKQKHKVAGKQAHWNMTIDSKSGQLGLLHRKPNVHIITNDFIK